MDVNVKDRLLIVSEKTRKIENNKMGHLFLNYISRGLVVHENTMSAAEILTISSEFDIFAHRPIETSILETIVTV